MANGVWSFAHLNPNQEQALKEAEQSVGDGILLALSETKVTPSDLSPDQMEKLHDAEKKLGVTLVAVRKG